MTKDQLNHFNFNLVEGNFEKPKHAKPAKKFKSNNMFKPGIWKEFQKREKETIIFLFVMHILVLRIYF